MTSITRSLFRSKSIVQPVTFQRAFHTSYIQQQQGENNSPVEKLTDKFIQQAKRQRRLHGNKVEPTRFVQIDHMPPTSTSEDINKLAREAFPKGDRSIDEMIFCRNHEFNFNGRVVVAMASSEDARRLIEYGHRRALGGHIVKMQYMGDGSSTNNSIMNKHRRSELTNMADSTSAAGRSVIISGLPPRTLTEHLLGYMRSKNFHPLQGTPDNVLRLATKHQSTVSKFLVKFDSESEAWRCVRTFHNTDFFFKTTQENFKLKVTVAY
ncbi:hypothetical protein EDC96DRAFT_474210 [Choanephora cucurbitarum]|nr:hypothetical protein EDC96DRAFT_474210 [Choanephora cucurbitarum]